MMCNFEVGKLNWKHDAELSNGHGNICDVHAELSNTLETFELFFNFLDFF